MKNSTINGRSLNPLPDSMTGANFIVNLAHAWHSAELDPKTFKVTLPATNNDTLSSLECDAEAFEVWLSDSIGAVGVALGVSNKMDEESVKKLGWLIAGLTELQIFTAEVKNLIDRSKEL